LFFFFLFVATASNGALHPRAHLRAIWTIPQKSFTALVVHLMQLQHLARECTTSPSHTLMSFQSYNTFPVP
jgi:hypothetical protein